MRTVAIIQARMGSTRLPGKIMADLCGKPMLQHIIERVKRAKLVDEVVVATPFSEDQYRPIRDLCIDDTPASNHLAWVLAPKVDENDLIGRYCEAARIVEADIIVRICADNPFVDPDEIDRAVAWHSDRPGFMTSNMHQHPAQCMATGQTNGYPDGIGCEVYDFEILSWMHKRLHFGDQREHPHIWWHRAGLIRSPRCPSEISRPDLRLDVNTQSDLDYVRSIYEILYTKNPQFTTKEVIDAIDENNLEKRPTAS